MGRLILYSLFTLLFFINYLEASYVVTCFAKMKIIEVDKIKKLENKKMYSLYFKVNKMQFASNVGRDDSRGNECMPILLKTLKEDGILSQEKDELENISVEDTVYYYYHYNDGGKGLVPLSSAISIFSLSKEQFSYELEHAQWEDGLLD